MRSSLSWKTEFAVHPTRTVFVSNGDQEDPPGPARRSSQSSAPHEDLPYKVELWDADKKVVEQVLAVTASGSIGYAAYHAATREYPDRFVTLRHKKSIVARSSGAPN